MRVLGLFFCGCAVLAATESDSANAQFFTLLGGMHLIGASVIRAINKGDR